LWFGAPEGRQERPKAAQAARKGLRRALLIYLPAATYIVRLSFSFLTPHKNLLSLLSALTEITQRAPRDVLQDL
jgi:hypothetical protein